MVEPAEGMRETGNETVRVADAGMSEGGGGNEREGGGRQANAHVVPWCRPNKITGTKLHITGTVCKGAPPVARICH
jgi:hypothetical protein